MLSQGDSKKMLALIAAIDAEISAAKSEISKLSARMSIVSADLERIREKLL
jgi:hypothetical protein